MIADRDDPAKVDAPFVAVDANPVKLTSEAGGVGFHLDAGLLTFSSEGAATEELGQLTGREISW